MESFSVFEANTGCVWNMLCCTEKDTELKNGLLGVDIAVQSYFYAK
jgi:hypothetical protein